MLVNFYSQSHGEFRGPQPTETPHPVQHLRLYPNEVGFTLPDAPGTLYVLKSITAFRLRHLWKGEIKVLPDVPQKKVDVPDTPGKHRVHRCHFCGCKTTNEHTMDNRRACAACVETRARWQRAVEASKDFPFPII